MKLLFVMISLATLIVIPPSMASGTYKMVGDMIYVDGSPMAQLRFFKINGIDTNTTNTGIAIYYFDTHEQIWVCPKDGWRLKDAKEGTIYYDITQIDSLYRSDPHKYYFLRKNDELSKYEFLTGGCLSYNVDDKFLISVTLPGMFWNGTAKFDVINRKFK